MSAKAAPALLVGLFAGVVAGASPFCLVGLEGGTWGVVALVVAAVAGAAGCPAPGWWCLGVCLGIAGGWATWVALIGAGWKLLVYVPMAFSRVYVVSVLALVLAIVVRNPPMPRRWPS